MPRVASGTFNDCVQHPFQPVTGAANAIPRINVRIPVADDIIDCNDWSVHPHVQLVPNLVERVSRPPSAASGTLEVDDRGACEPLQEGSLSPAAALVSFDPDDLRAK